MKELGVRERSADVNAAYWKAIPEAFADGIEDVGVTSCAIGHETFQNGSKCITL